jgi:hypothetical protein
MFHILLNWRYVINLEVATFGKLFSSGTLFHNQRFRVTYVKSQNRTDVDFSVFYSCATDSNNTSQLVGNHLRFTQGNISKTLVTHTKFTFPTKSPFWIITSSEIFGYAKVPRL